MLPFVLDYNLLNLTFFIGYIFLSIRIFYIVNKLLILNQTHITDKDFAN